MHIGSAENVPRKHYAPGYRGASVASSSYLEDLKRGGEIVKEKSETAFAGFFGGSAQDSPASGRGAVAQRESQREEKEGDSEVDAFEEYYKKNYASGRGGSSSAEQSSWAGMGGGGSAYGGSGGGGYTETSAGAEDGGAARKGEPAGEEAPGAAAQAPAPGTGFGKPPTGLERAAAPRLQTSLPGKNSRERQVHSGARPGFGRKRRQPAASLSGMPGQKAGFP